MNAHVFIRKSQGPWVSWIVIGGYRHKTLYTMTRWGALREIKKALKEYERRGSNRLSAVQITYL